MKTSIAFGWAVALVAATVCVQTHAATIVIVNNDGAGEGFNDPAPAAPEGGNTGTTRGAQRLILFQTAARAWGALLKSNRIIHVRAQFDPLLPCASGSGVLGSAGPTGFFSFNSAPPPTHINTWYPVALAEALANQNINTTDPEINATFNSSIDNACLNPGTRFWYGIDPAAVASRPPGTVPLFPTLLHELGHGLGFSTLVCVNANASGVPQPCGATPFGGLASGVPDIWTYFLAASGNPSLKWKDMTDMQHAAGITSDPTLVWTGANVTAGVPTFQAGGAGTNAGFMRMHAPATVAPGSSVSHYTGASNPNLLMEPVLQSGVFNNTDLTYSLLQDIGWLMRPRDTIFADGLDAN